MRLPFLSELEVRDRSQDPDRTLAQIFYDQIKASGHQPFMAGESIQIWEDWAERIDAELNDSASVPMRARSGMGKESTDV